MEILHYQHPTGFTWVVQKVIVVVPKESYKWKDPNNFSIIVIPSTLNLSTYFMPRHSNGLTLLEDLYQSTKDLAPILLEENYLKSTQILLWNGHYRVVRISSWTFDSWSNVLPAMNIFHFTKPRRNFSNLSWTMNIFKLNKSVTIQGFQKDLSKSLFLASASYRLNGPALWHGFFLDFLDAFV